MRALLIATLLGNLALGFISVVLLPDRVATHFGAGGAADAWGSAQNSALFMMAVHVALFVLFVTAPRIIKAVPPWMVNLPHRDYWLTPEHRDEAAQRLSTMLDEFGSALYIFFIVAGILTIKANLSDPVVLNEPIFLAATFVYLTYAAWWVWRVFGRFRVGDVTSDE